MSLPACTPALAPPPSLLTPPRPNSKPDQPAFPLCPQSTKHRLPRTHTPIDPIVSWTSSIALHCRNGRLPQAAAEFSRMQFAGVRPNHITFITLLSACTDFDFTLEGLRFGVSIHALVRKLGLDTDNVMVGTALVKLYSKCGRLDLAWLMFDEMRVKNPVSWNAMIDGCMKNGKVGEAIMLFDQMPARDAISWTCMIGGFVKKGCFEQALEWFREMQLAGVEPDYVTIISVLAACANLGAFGLGLWINLYVIKRDFKDNIKINNSLIDMYSRCGCIHLSRQVFEQMPERSLVSWNSMIVGLALNGHAEEALEFFNLMCREGFRPDGVSFTGVLTACSHSGLVNEGLQFFDIMKRTYKTSPRIEHYGCLVDLYSRAGRLEDALNVVAAMPMKPNEVVLGSLLAACRTHGDVGLAERIMKCLLKVDPGTDSNYVLLSNIYAAVGRWDGASKVRMKMKALGIHKKPGFSSIEIDGNIHEFVAGDKSHVETQNMYAMLDHLFAELVMCGYVPEIEVGKSYEHD